MSGTPIDRLQDLQDDVHAAHGVWGAHALAEASSAAAQVPTFGGRAEALQGISDAITDAARTVSQVQPALEAIQTINVDGVWAGAAHNAAADALNALHDDVTRLHAALNVIVRNLRDHAVTLADATRSDLSGIDGLAEAAAVAGAMTMGQVPDPFGYDGEKMRAAHHEAMASIDLRVAAHVAVRNAGEDYTSAMHDLATQARGRELGATAMSSTTAGITPLDAIVLADAGGQYGGSPQILTAAADARAAAALRAMTDGDRGRMMALLAGARSLEQRAYLLKALAAGYSVDEVGRFDEMIAARGNDPTWLDQHLSPLQMDEDPEPGREPNTFGSATWNQGDHPTCVAASTVAARAEVDPLYALQLTTGGHPGDPSFDSPDAFVARLRDEQTRVYDGGRNWWQEIRRDDGMTDTQSATVANAEIAPHTGARYDNVEMKNEQARDTTLRSVERAVDDGYPVPLITTEGDESHQMLVIGHSSDSLQLYNPWGYTYWITESEFVSGHVDGIDPDIPRTPTSVRLPEGAR
jgi:uncharacterized protein YukE